MGGEGAVLIAYRRPGETRAGLLRDGPSQDGRIQDLRVDRDGGLAAGTILRGRVLRVDRSLKAVFVDIGQRAPGFLPLTKLRRGTDPHEGESLILQVANPQTHQTGREDKGAVLTGDIALRADLAVLTPRTADIVVSKKIGTGADRKRLRESLAAALPEGIGAIARTRAAEASPEALAAEVRDLCARWAAMEKLSGPVLWSPPPGWHDLADHATAFRGERLAPPPGFAAAALAPGDADLLDAAVEAALERAVPIAGGKGRLVIDRTEALTAIDIDGSLPAKALAEAAFAEIPRQIRLRGLAGIVVIDPPRLRRADLGPVVDALSAVFAGDPVETVVHGLTRAGLVEITRARTRPTLAEVRAGDPMLTRGLDALHAAVQDALAEKRGSVTLTLEKAVAARLRAEERALIEARERFGVAVVLEDG
ncbi:MAG: ribonuclease E/G [Alphaproteobacteria bacterium]|nr:ribonuclease E/G [Alphaproteobacteria bacterium]